VLKQGVRVQVLKVTLLCPLPPTHARLPPIRRGVQALNQQGVVGGGLALHGVLKLCVLQLLHRPGAQLGLKGYLCQQLHHALHALPQHIRGKHELGVGVWGGMRGKGEGGGGGKGKARGG
jgi:hypothetical protein